MEIRILNEREVTLFQNYLEMEERSNITIEKYIRDINRFISFSVGRPITKDVVIEYKNGLIKAGYKPRSINSMIAAINSLFAFLGWHDCKVKSIKFQPRIYCSAEKELTKSDYMKLLKAAETKPQIKLVMQTICATGIRVSELKHFTVETVKQGEISVNCKGKIRTILLPDKLKKILLQYARKEGITTGIIFKSRNGKALSRGSIWAQMKELCKRAGVSSEKVFPHNLRKLFARTFYAIEKDIAKLADVLGHSNINTTRIYIITTGSEHRRKIERLGLVI